MEGILQHMPALLALTLPTQNSYRRVGPGCWTGSKVSWGFDDKEQVLRVVPNVSLRQWDHFEYKVLDHQANLYLAIAGILMAGLDGIENKLELRACDSEATNSEAPGLPTDVASSLECLQNDALLMSGIPAGMSRGYFAVRRAEWKRSLEMELSDEVDEALQRA
jgi:glutamine synthetase